MILGILSYTIQILYINNVICYTLTRRQTFSYLTSCQANFSMCFLFFSTLNPNHSIRGKSYPLYTLKKGKHHSQLYRLCIMYEKIFYRPTVSCFIQICVWQLKKFSSVNYRLPVG